jgi:hypothetical protein
MFEREQRVRQSRHASLKSIHSICATCTLKSSWPINKNSSFHLYGASLRRNDEYQHYTLVNEHFVYRCIPVMAIGK